MKQGKIYRDSLSKERPLFLKTVIGALVPFVMVYGIYILFNGTTSPGGGFSGGAILGVSIVLTAVGFGPKKVFGFFPYKTIARLRVIAFVTYILLLLYAFIMYNQGLSTIFPLGTAGNIFSGGMILPLNLSIGIVKVCTIYSLYGLFAEGEL